MTSNGNGNAGGQREPGRPAAGAAQAGCGRRGLRAAEALLGTLLMIGVPACSGGPTSPDGLEGGRTASRIEVKGGGPELHGQIDGVWSEVNRCWGAALPGRGITVSVVAPELYDRNGAGVIRHQGTLCYGAREGNAVFVAPDLRALRHEFSHVVGERVTGAPVENGAGKCWL